MLPALRVTPRTAFYSSSQIMFACSFTWPGDTNLDSIKDSSSSLILIRLLQICCSFYSQNHFCKCELSGYRCVIFLDLGYFSSRVKGLFSVPPKTVNSNKPKLNRSILLIACLPLYGKCSWSRGHHVLMHGHWQFNIIFSHFQNVADLCNKWGSLKVSMYFNFLDKGLFCSRWLYTL